MPKAIDLTGLRIGRLVVIRSAGRSASRQCVWLCRCDCGNIATKDGYGLRIGKSVSCGCNKSEAISRSRSVDLTGHRFGSLVVIGEADRVRGRRYWNCLCDCGRQPRPKCGAMLVAGQGLACSKTCTHLAKRLYADISVVRIWHGIKGRCTRPGHVAYPKYGGRGITMCVEWQASFNAFYSHIGPRPSDHHTVDRIDNTKGYEPGNVRWATRKEQARNTRLCRLLTHEGVTLPVAAWAERIGVKASLLRGRLQLGLPVHRVLCPQLLSPRVQNAPISGIKSHPSYKIFSGMQGRCRCKTNLMYPRYGGRGIRVCRRWAPTPEGFRRFVADMGPRPSLDHQLDRIDNDGPYSPANCRWATRKEQARNRGTTRRLVCHGLALSLAEWAERSGVPRGVISNRIDRLGWDVGLALSTPVQRTPASRPGEWLR